MVTTRTNPTNRTNVNTFYLQALASFGSSFTYSTETETVDSLGNVTAISTASKTISGDFQIETDEFKIQQLGFAGQGVARFYGRSSDSLDTDGKITRSDGDVWILRKKIEDDEWSGIEVSSVWWVVRLDG